MALSVTNLGIEGLEEVEQIGTGGSSRVYRARQVDLDRVVAIKVLNPGHDQGVAKRFDRERKAMGRLSNHEGIVPVYSSGVTAHDEPYLVMPYYPNGSLQDQIETGPLEWQTAVSYVDVAAETIAAAHDEGIVHLDLKPANILLTNNGAPRIADFGIARLTTSTNAGTTGATAFTPAYSAPETFLDGDTGPPSDVYGLGATLWALLVGHPPFLTPGEDTNLMAVIGRVVNNPVGDLRKIAPGPICEVIERAMAKQPSERYQTAREFSLALKQASSASSTATSHQATSLFPAPAAAAGPANPTATTQLEFSTDMTATGPAATPLASVPAPTPAPAPAHAPAQRSLLQHTADAIPRPPQGPPDNSTPFVDFDRFRFGPILAGALAFIVIIGAAVWVLTRGPGDTEAADVQTDPAGPATEDPDQSTSSLSTSTPSTDGSSSSPTSPSETSETTATTEPTTSSSSETTDPSSTETTETTDTTTSSSSETSETTDTTDTTVGTPVEQPTDLTATVTANGENVRLAWTAPATGPTPDGYRILRNGTSIADVTATSFVDPNLADGTYTYTVLSRLGEEVSAPSNSATITIGDLEVTALTVNRSADGERLSISFSSNKCSTYRVNVLVKPAGPPLEGMPIVGPEGVPCKDNESLNVGGLDPASLYQVNLVVQAGEERATAVWIEPDPAVDG